MMLTKIHWIETHTLGRIGIMPRPRGGDQLGQEIQALRESNVHALVSLLTDAESLELDLQDEATECQQQGIEFLSFPIRDRQVPALDFQLLSFIRNLAAYLESGQNVVIHCRMGVGRASIIAASTLVLCGMDHEAAFSAIQEARGCEVPDTAEQRQWVTKFARTYQSIISTTDLWT